MPQPSSFQWPVRVYYEDTDVSGVVYHANYLRWFERCRTEWLRSLGYSQEALKNTLNVAFTLSEALVKYRVPARLDDELLIRLQIAHAGRVSIRFSQQVCRVGDDIVLAEGEFRVASVSMADFKPCAVPEPIRAGIQAYLTASNRND